MKFIFFLLLSSLSLNLMALEPAAFKDTYPDFKNYQNILFNDLKTYFETLPVNSIIYSDKDGIRIFKIRKHSGGFQTITSKISRIKSESQILERVIYYLENSEVFGYEVKKTGKNVTASEDLDLLSFRFKPKVTDEFFQVSIPYFKVLINHHNISNTEDKSFFSLGFMGFNVQVETSIIEKTVQRNYIYFFKHMPTPQASLGVKAVEKEHDWSGTQYIHFASGAGEITPKQFFGGLADGAQAFHEASSIMVNVLKSEGFPKFD